MTEFQTNIKFINEFTDDYYEHQEVIDILNKNLKAGDDFTFKEGANNQLKIVIW